MQDRFRLPTSTLAWEGTRLATLAPILLQQTLMLGEAAVLARLDSKDQAQTVVMGGQESLSISQASQQCTLQVVVAAPTRVSQLGLEAAQASVDQAPLAM